MEYIKVTCLLTPDSELTRELLAAELGNCGFESFVETAEGIEAYIPGKDFTPEMMKSENLADNEFFGFEWTMESIPDQNWNEVWEQNYFEPILIDETCLVRAPFHHDHPSAPVEIIINPRMAFGTGNHETTWLMIKTMSAMALENAEVLDMGCGSGILSVYASKKGASRVTAVDIDEWSFENTLENCELNDCHNVEVLLGDAALLPGRSFDVILANIQRNVLLQDMETYRDALRLGGKLLMSGFYRSDLDQISERAGSLGMVPVEFRERSEWCAALFAR